MRDWREYVDMTDDELARQDVGAMNLAFAVGLPGSERIDAAGCLKALDDWATGIAIETDSLLKTVYPRDAEKYGHSVPLYRMVVLVRVLQKRCRVLYNPAKINVKPNDPYETDDQFIHGAIQGPGGTCASLPVVYTAVGRRMGYPIRLARTWLHVFCRWDDPDAGVRFNIEGTNHDGVSNYPDDHYRQWPIPLDPRTEERMGFLRSLTPKGEVAHFLGNRGVVPASAGEYAQAIDMYALAVEHDNRQNGYDFAVGRVILLWVDKLRAEGRIGHGFWYPTKPNRERRWARMPWSLEARILALQAAAA